MESRRKQKTDINIAKNCKQSIIAGVMIGLGVIINTQTTPPILGATLFSFGLLTIIHLRIPLFTGKIGFIKFKDQYPYLMVLAMNLVGIALVVILYWYSNSEYYTILAEAAQVKFSKTYLAMFIGGILCGYLIHIAVKCRTPIITVGAIILFILIGSEHCIADFPYLLTTIGMPYIAKWILVIIGNSIGAVFAERMLE